MVAVATTVAVVASIVAPIVASTVASAVRVASDCCCNTSPGDRGGSSSGSGSSSSDSGSNNSRGSNNLFSPSNRDDDNFTSEVNSNTGSVGIFQAIRIVINARQVLSSTESANQQRQMNIITSASSNINSQGSRPPSQFLQNAGLGLAATTPSTLFPTGTTGVWSTYDDFGTRAGGDFNHQTLGDRPITQQPQEPPVSVVPVLPMGIGQRPATSESATLEPLLNAMLQSTTFELSLGAGISGRVSGVLGTIEFGASAPVTLIFSHDGVEEVFKTSAGVSATLLDQVGIAFITGYSMPIEPMEQYRILRVSERESLSSSGFIFPGSNTGLAVTDASAANNTDAILRLGASGYAVVGGGLELSFNLSEFFRILQNSE